MRTRFDALGRGLPVAMAALMLGAGQGQADSCWDHNGSVMRLTASGSQRSFVYDQPRAGLREVGVQPGTWLFSGHKQGDWYRGSARVFSGTGCEPLDYPVEGPVLHNPLRVEMTGRREVYSSCVPTGQWRTDVLVFTYLYDC